MYHLPFNDRDAATSLVESDSRLTLGYFGGFFFVDEAERFAFLFFVGLGVRNVSSSSSEETKGLFLGSGKSGHQKRRPLSEIGRTRHSRPTRRR